MPVSQALLLGTDPDYGNPQLQRALTDSNFKLLHWKFTAASETALLSLVRDVNALEGESVACYPYLPTL